MEAQLAPRREPRPDHAPGSRGQRWLERLPAMVAVAVLATIAAGLAIKLALPDRAFGSWLGVPYPPFFAFWSPRAGAPAPIAAVVLGAAAAYTPRLRSRTLAPGAFAAITFGLSLGLHLALAAARAGTLGWYSAFQVSPHAGKEYLPALPALDLGLGTFLDRFAEIAPTLPIHPSAHPPGLLVLMQVLGIDSPRPLAWLVILIAALAAPLTYLLGRRLLDEQRGRTAALLFVFAPSAAIYGVTSADALFATLGAGSAVLLVAGSRPARALGPAALLVASFFSYALIAVGAWAALATAVRHGVRPAARLAGWCAAALVAGYGVLWLATGFDPHGTLAAADDAYRDGIYHARPYGYWLFGSPAAFLVALGLPLAWYALRAIPTRNAPALAFAGVVVAAAVLGYSKAETERIWLFMVPFACVAAASALPSRYLAPVLCALAAQAVVVELLFFTIW